MLLAMTQIALFCNVSSKEENVKLFNQPAKPRRHVGFQYIQQTMIKKHYNTMHER